MILTVLGVNDLSPIAVHKYMLLLFANASHH